MATPSMPDTTFPPPPSASPERIEAWFVEQLSAARLVAKEARDLAADAKDTAQETKIAVDGLVAKIGCSPDPALGVEGKGFLGGLSKQIAWREDEEKRKAERRTLFAGFSAALGLIAVVIGILKGVGLLR